MNARTTARVIGTGPGPATAVTVPSTASTATQQCGDGRVALEDFIGGPPDVSATAGPNLGVAGVAGNRAPVSPRPYGVNTTSLWVADHYQRQVPPINGSDTNFSHPFPYHRSSRRRSPSQRPSVPAAPLAGMPRAGRSVAPPRPSVLARRADLVSW